MADRDLNKELKEAARAKGRADSGEERQALAILQRLGVSLPPTLNHDVDGSFPPDYSFVDESSTVSLEVPALGMDVWAGQDRLGFAPTLDVDEVDSLTTAANAVVDDEEQERIGRYVVIGELGSGGMGRVVEALDRDLGRRLAIKVVRDPAELTESRLARFVSEAQLTAQLEHPHIVPVHELGVTSRGQLYYAMKKVDGVSLAEVLARIVARDRQVTRRWGLRRLLGVFVKVCLATGYAHRRGVVHRDLKPDNIMLGEFGEVLLLDWGLARLFAKPVGPDEDLPTRSIRPNLTRVGAATGTPGYLSPEQARGRRHLVGPTSDVWSLGAILYEILTGSTPFSGEDPLKYLDAVLEEDVVDPRDRAPERRIPSDLAAICMEALSPRPQDRFRDGRELAQAIEDWLEGARRRKEARTYLDEASQWWDQFRSARLQQATVQAQIHLLEAEVHSWTPVDEKLDLLSARDEQQSLLVEAARAWGEAVVAGERALAHDPGNKRARSFLASAYWARMQEAERRGDHAEQALYELRVRAYDDGPLRSLLRGDGAVSLRTEPAGAQVVAERFEAAGVRLRIAEQRRMPPTPLIAAPLGQGSWRLRVQLPGRAEVVYPVEIVRGGHWDADGVPLPQEVPAGFRYVPPGPAQLGATGGAIDALEPGLVEVAGFFAAVEPVTVGEYLAFLDALHARDPDEAWARVPRQGGALNEEPERYLARPVDGRYAVPEADAQGDSWDLRFPVFSISAGDAEAYAAWRTDVTGRTHRLLTEQEWEKAARGVDGRTFPWGDAREATLCWNRDAQSGRPQPQPLGLCEDDVSVYGLRDVAGGITEWTSTPSDDGARRVCRGGSWASTLRQCELACRLTTDPDRVFTYLGFRLALDL